MEATIAIQRRIIGPRSTASLRRVAAALALAVVSALVVRAPLGPGQASPAAGKAHPTLLAAAETRPQALLSVIVRETSPSADAEGLVGNLEGTVTRDLSIMGGFAARIPGGSLDDLLASPAVERVWADGHVQMLGVNDECDDDDEDECDPEDYADNPSNRVWMKAIELDEVPSRYEGTGVTVALLDTGITPVPDLETRVLARVDFTPDHDGYDRYGHGTHLAGIIAGAGADGDGDDDEDDDGDSDYGAPRVGVAPEANLVSVKVAGADGSTDVSVVIAGLQWVLENKDRYGIRILNLAFGTDSTQTYLVDPLNYAVEQLWASGVFMVVSAGNRGPDVGTINKPGDDPFVLTVGAADLMQTGDDDDDVVADFSSRGPTQDAIGKPDLVAPGTTIVSNRAPGSTIDTEFPQARVGDAHFKGTGTSQAAAIVSGIAALMLEANPSLTPDQIKAVLMGTTDDDIADQSGAGTGLVDAEKAVETATSTRKLGRISPVNLGLVPSTGDGSLEASRGTFHVMADLDGDGVMDIVEGEIDVLGFAWDARSWSARSWSSTPWVEYVEETPGWEARSWSARSWSGTMWDARSWSARSWSARTWSGKSWG